MERIAVVGVTIQDESVSALDQLRRPCDGGLRPFLHDLADDLAASELVVLSTCNRCEVYYARESGDLPDRGDVAAVAAHLGVGDSEEWLHRLRQRRGRAAARHLFRVAASLDSLVVGESQILGQIRGAVRFSENAGLIGGLLAPLFAAALRAGKRVRSSTGLARHSLSVVALGVDALRARLPDVGSRQVAVIGAGSTARLAARTLHGRGLSPALIVNRTLETARRLAVECEAEAMRLDDFLAAPKPIDVLVSATGASSPLMQPDELRALAARTPGGGPLFCLDLAVPRDLPVVVDPSVVPIDLEQLRDRAARNRMRRTDAARAAEMATERCVDRFVEGALDRRLAVSVSAVLAEARDRFESELGALCTGRLARLSDRDRAAVERWARTAFGRLAHLPLRAAKRLAHEVPDLLEPGDEETVG